MIKEAKKSLLAFCELENQETIDAILSKPQSLRTRGPLFKGREDRCLSLSRERVLGLPPWLLLFKPSTDYMMSTHIGESDLLYCSNAKLFWKYPHRHSQK